jgi:hypothetical protein
MKRRLVSYGLELTVDCGIGCGPSACCSSPRPMHWPEFAPVQGMPSTVGSPPGDVSPNAGEFGTKCGRHTAVKLSGSSPAGHWASGTELVGTTKTAIAGAAATATANPPARMSRRAECWKVAIITLSVVFAEGSLGRPEFATALEVSPMRILRCRTRSRPVIVNKVVHRSHF